MQSNKVVAKPAQRVIKKYPNRRLYDTETSTYITLTEVKELVMRSVPFVVRDAKSGVELTRSILLQIILEEEAGGAPMFTEPVLASIIRFHGKALHGFMGSYLEKNIQAMTEMQALESLFLALLERVMPAAAMRGAAEETSAASRVRVPDTATP